MKRKRSSSIDMSSLMDIVFILLIFVMISISFQKKINVLEMDLPSGSGKPEIELKEFTISIYEDGKLFLNKEELSWDKLTSKLKTLEKDKIKILLNIEKKVPYEEFIKISELLKNYGIEKVELGVLKN